MTTQTKPHASPKKKPKVDEKIDRLRKAFADAPDVGKKALENVLKDLESQASKAPPPPVESAGRTGSRLGKVSELTIIFVGSSRVDLQACKLEYSIVSPK